MALKNPDNVELKIYATDNGRGETLGKALLWCKRETLALGKNLHIVAVTAKPVEDNCLQTGQIYAYDLYFEAAKVNLINATIIPNSKSNLSYFPHQLPTFALPPQNLNYLKIVYSSCRKPHGGGIDALSCLDKLIEEGADLANQRPHQLFLTGDQIFS